MAFLPITMLAQSGRQQHKTSTPQSNRPPRAESQVSNTKATTRPSDPPVQTGDGRTPSGKPVPPRSRQEEDDVVRITSNLVVVPASVLDRHGRAVTDLNLTDFQLFVDGQPKPLSALSRSETPVRLAVLFDNSGSLTETRALQIQAAMSFFRRVMRPIDQAAIFSVSTVATLEQPLTNNVADLVRTIEGFGKPEGGTALFDAIAQAATYLRPQAGRKVVVIVSDGVDTVSRLDFEGALRQAQTSDCQIYVVQTGLVENANVRQLAAERRMQEFSAQTGGSAYTPKRVDDLDEAFTQIAAELAQQYILSYYPSDDRRDGRFYVLRVVIKTRPGLNVRARKGYFAPKA